MKYDVKNVLGKKVLLIDDLTRYHKSLTKGSIGKTIGCHGLWSRNYPERFMIRAD